MRAASGRLVGWRWLVLNINNTILCALLRERGAVVAGVDCKSVACCCYRWPADSRDDCCFARGKRYLPNVEQWSRVVVTFPSPDSNSSRSPVVDSLDDYNMQSWCPKRRR